MQKKLLEQIQTHARIISTLDELKQEYDSIGRRGIPLDPALRPKETVVWQVPRADGFSFCSEEDYTNIWVAQGWHKLHHLGIATGDTKELRSQVNAALDSYCSDVERMGFTIERIPHPENVPAMNFVYIDNTYGVYHTSAGNRLMFFANFQHENRKPEERIVYSFLKSHKLLDELPTLRSPWFDEINGNFFYSDIVTRTDKKLDETDRYLKANIQCFSSGPHARTSFESVQFTSAALGTHIIALELKSHKEKTGATHKERLLNGGAYHGNIGMTFIDDWCYFVPDIFENPKEVTQLLDYLFEGRIVAITPELDSALYDEALTVLPLNCVYLGKKDNTPYVAVIQEAPLFIAFLKSKGVHVLPQAGAALGAGGGGFYCATTYRHAALTPQERNLFELKKAPHHKPLDLKPYRELVYHGE